MEDKTATIVDPVDQHAKWTESDMPSQGPTKEEQELMSKLTETKLDFGAIKAPVLTLKRVPKAKRSFHVCLAAVMQDGLAVKYCPCRDRLILLTAVMQNGLALQHLLKREQELIIRKAAVMQNGFALQYAKPQELQLCVLAIQQNAFSLQHVDRKHKIISLAAPELNRLAVVIVNQQAVKYAWDFTMIPDSMIPADNPGEAAMAPRRRVTTANTDPEPAAEGLADEAAAGTPEG